MLRTNLSVVCIAIVGVVAAAVLARPHLAERFFIMRSADRCDAIHTETSRKLDCWLQIALHLVESADIRAGFRAFSYLYTTYPVFASSGCHRHAHRLGDTAYYNYYVARDLDVHDISFPQEATACGYGFFHGFIEHLVQNRLDQEFVVETCEYLRDTYASRMRDIGTICYHASGHGFMQAEADTMESNLWGKPDRIVERPLEMCEQLPTDDREIEDCREGVFNVLVDWMAIGDFGLSQNLDDPLALCSRVREEWRYACFYELSQNLGQLTLNSPRRAAAFVAPIDDDELRRMTFGVMVAGMMQSETALNAYRSVLAECATIESELYETCVVSSANGMMEHGSPGQEFERVLDLCASDFLSDGGKSACYNSLANRLARFYPPAKVADVCARIPSSFQSSCAAI